MKRTQGFTITELMITIVIMGVLAMLAIPGFTSYIYRQVGTALVLVTHDESICQGADRRFQMQDGRLEQTA